MFVVEGGRARVRRVLVGDRTPEYFEVLAVGTEVVWCRGHIRVYGDGKAKVSYVALNGVVQATIASIDSPAVSRQSIPIGGPTAISQLDALALAESVTGKKMQVEFMTAEQMAAARSAAQDPLSRSFLGLFESLAHGDEVPAAWGSTLGIRPQSMQEWFSRKGSWQ